MKPVAIRNMTRDLAKPEGWDEKVNGPCDSLPIRDVPRHGDNAMLSHWKPTERDLEVLNNGGVVELCVCGYGHPPVSITATMPEEGV